MTKPFRCSGDSELRDEPLIGTASTVRAFLLIECPGAWGVDAVHENRLPRTLMTELAQRAGRYGVRLLMVRRHGRSKPVSTTVLAAYAAPREPFLESTCLTDPEELLDLDLAALGAGRSPGLTPCPDPVFLVCTHGKHDVCCAERGRPVAAALHRHVPDSTWEVSHIGGDRFAGNMLVLPDGLYYGRVTPESATHLVDRHRSGHLDLAMLRGRCGYPFPVQAAEIFLRRAIDRTETDALRLTSRDGNGEECTATFEDQQRQSWKVRVRIRSATPQQLTCRALRTNPPPRHELVSIDEL